METLASLLKKHKYMGKIYLDEEKRAFLPMRIINGAYLEILYLNENEIELGFIDLSKTDNHLYVKDYQRK